MADPYWDAVGRKKEAQREYLRRHRGRLYRRAREAALNRHSPVGKVCTCCGSEIREGGMLNPNSPHNSAFCGPKCYGEYKTWMENRFGFRVTEHPEGPSNPHEHHDAPREPDPGV